MIGNIAINRPRVYGILNTTAQTRQKMDTELKEYVLNPDIPDTPVNHREVYQRHHPDEILTQDDIIHHINGDHNDNRADNLERLTSHSVHRLKHMALLKVLK